MKLTNYIRDAFISSVMDDVPSVDYESQFRSAVFKAALEQMPAIVRKAWAAGHEDWFNKESVYPVRGSWGTAIPCPDRSAFRLPADVMNTCETLGRLGTEQANARSDLRQKLHAIAYSCTTRKALAEALPEFVKYLPAETETSRNLPVIANVVTDFIKAGWPKEKANA